MATKAGGQHGSPKPTAQQVSAVFSPGAAQPAITGPVPVGTFNVAQSTRFDEYTIKTTGAIETAFQGRTITAGLIYICHGVTAGILQQMQGTTYVGRVSKYLTEIRVQGDENTPVLISETSTSELQSAQVWVKGTAGDVLVLIYR